MKRSRRYNNKYNSKRKTQKSAKSLRRLIKDFEHYSPLHRTHHSGNLKQHSVWVTYYLQEAIKTPGKSPLGDVWNMIKHIKKTKRLRLNFERILIVSSLLHDIGKGGDLIFEYLSKPGHEKKGYLYLDEQEPYLLKNGKKLSIKELLRDFSTEEQEWIKWLVLYHWNLGILLKEKRPRAPHSIEKIAKEFIESLHNINSRTSLGKIFVLLQFMLCCADVLGAQPYCGDLEELDLFKYPEFSKDCFPTDLSMYKYYGYSSFVPKLINALYEQLNIT